MDITNSINALIDFIINGITSIYTWMSNVTFLGTNLLTFTITLFLLNAILPIILTLIKTDSVDRGYSAGKTISDYNEKRNQRIAKKEYQKEFQRELNK